MLRTLFSRLSLTFAAILLCLGLVTLNIGHRSQQRYFEEFTQELNRPVAMYMATQTRLFVNGLPDRQALAELATHVAIINPSLVVYLLDVHGKILAAAPYTGADFDQYVDIQPLLQFLSGDNHLPIVGEDPAVPGEKRVFSVFPVSGADAGNSGCLQCGYLYVVLGGATHRSLFQRLWSSYSLQAATAMFTGVLVFALLAGIAVFFMMTRPLRAMTRTLGEWRLAMTDQRFPASIPGLHPTRPADELRALEQTCLNMARRLDQQFIELDTADKRRRRFLTSVSHDLRTPLTSLSGAIETLLLKKEQLCEQDVQRYLQLAQRQATRLRNLIVQVFEMARLDSGDIELQLEPLSLTELVFDTVQDIESEAARSGVYLTVTNDCSSTRVSVLADMGMMQRVLENLIFNAIRHTPPGGSVRVSIQARSEHSVGVEVIDTGRGFPRAMEACPLTAFIDLEDASAETGSCRAASGSAQLIGKSPGDWAHGSGLGLGIVQRMLALHDSQAMVWSQPGAGTTIRFALPLSFAARAHIS